MARLRACLGVAWALSLATACGYTESGTGTHTLQVNGSVSYNPTEASDASALFIEVKKQGVSITDALVQLTDADTGEKFTVPAAGTAYKVDWPGYHRRIAWHIVAGNDHVMCQLEGPGRHTVSAPAHASVQKMAQPLDVAWRTADGVRGGEVMLRLDPGAYKTTLAHDEGAVRIGAPDLAPGLTTISVLRRTAVVPAGAVAPSALSYDYEVQNTFLVN